MNNDTYNHDFSAFLYPILLILENHQFKSTVETLKEECKKLGYENILLHDKSSDLSPKIIFKNFSNVLPYRIIIETENAEQKTNESQTVALEENKNNNPNIIIETCTSTENDTENSEQYSVSETIIQNKECLNSYENKSKSQISTPDTTIVSNETENNVEYLKLKNKFSVLQSEHHKLMDILTELTFALQTSIKGQLHDTRSILNNCEKIYPELFCKFKNSTFIAQSNDNNANEPFNKELYNNTLENETYLNELNYRQIKHDLKNAELNAKLLLLQALRWRITKTSANIREYVLRNYVRFDILNVHSCSHKDSDLYSYDSIVFTSFYCTCKSSHMLQQAVTRFINALASIKLGRDYIVNNNVTLSILLSVILGTHPSAPEIDDITRDMIISTLQKISLRFTSRIFMINDGLTEFIVVFLSENYKNISEYCLEYSIALLRNLLLHKESRNKCHSISDELIQLLSNLLNEQYIFCHLYITGCLYNILPHKIFNISAKNINLETKLKQQIKNLDGEMKEQMQCVLEIYLHPDKWYPLCECSLELDETNEIDIIEPEIDQNETLTVSSPCGEEFLSIYKRTFNDGVNLNSNYINNILSVPVTPNFSANSAAKNKILDNVELKEQQENIQKINSKLLKEEKLPETEINNVDIEKNEKWKTKNNEKEMTFCEETQQLCYVPSKNGIFETDDTYILHTFSPSFIKNIREYDFRNISKSLPVSPRNRKLPSASTTVRSTSCIGNNFSPTFSGTCYRDNLKIKSFSTSNTPHIGFCDENIENTNIYSVNKYSCACYEEMQKSLEDESKKTTVTNQEKINNISIKNELRDKNPSNYCKYKCYPNSNSAPQLESLREKDSSIKSGFDESDYTSVFESRPKILRTP